MDVRTITINLKEKLKGYHLDLLFEKHESYGDYYYNLNSTIQSLEFDDYSIILPIPEEQICNIEILNFYLNKDLNLITIFMKDYSYGDNLADNYIAIAERIPDTNCFVTTYYHSCYNFPSVTSDTKCLLAG